MKKIFELQFKPGVKRTAKLEMQRRNAEALLNQNFVNAERSRKIYEIVERVAAGELTDDEAKAQIAKLMA